MGYFQHKHKNIEDAGILKNCKHCGDEFQMSSGNQKYCKDPACRDERWINSMSEKQWQKRINNNLKIEK